MHPKRSQTKSSGFRRVLELLLGAAHIFAPVIFLIAAPDQLWSKVVFSVLWIHPFVYYHYLFYKRIVLASFNEADDDDWVDLAGYVVYLTLTALSWSNLYMLFWCWDPQSWSGLDNPALSPFSYWVQFGALALNVLSTVGLLGLIPVSTLAQLSAAVNAFVVFLCFALGLNGVFVSRDKLQSRDIEQQVESALRRYFGDKGDSGMPMHRERSEMKL